MVHNCILIIHQLAVTVLDLIAITVTEFSEYIIIT